VKVGVRILIVFVAAWFFGAHFLTSADAQGRRVPFSHNTKAHKTGKFAECSSCHVLPEGNWKLPRRDKQEPFPDVTNFPYKRHTTCNSCHIREVFSDGGVFCGACHTTASMKARAVRPFPNRANPTQFRTLFPHDVHQDIIAAVPPKSDHAVAHFVNAAFRADDPPAPKKPAFYNCAVCHKALEAMPKPVPEARKPYQLKAVSDLVEDAPLELFTYEKVDGQPKHRFDGLTFRTWIDPTITDKPDTPQNEAKKQILPTFFMDSPTGHESCFSCHYQFQNLPKGKQSCAGCHELTNPFKPYFDKNVINRYSLKFDHSTKGHLKECTACHVQITSSDSLRRKDEDGKFIVEDVPFVSCRSCHDGGSGKFERIISTEIKKRKDDPAFQCAYCHTSAVGRFEIPASHKK